MPKKKTTLLISFIFILSICIGLKCYALYTPIPIIKNIENCRIAKLTYNPSFEKGEAELVDLTEFNETEVLTCLSGYKEKRTLNICKGSSLNNCQFHIYVDTGGDLKTILLGKNSFTCFSYGDVKYQIIDDEKLQEDLLKIINKDKSKNY